jgi:hypothetical protein
MASTEPPYDKFRRKTFVLYQFQSKYAIAAVLLSMFITVMTGMISYRLFRGPGGGGSPLELLESNGMTDGRGIWLVLGVFIWTICSFAFFYFIVIIATHRVAGPLAVISGHLEELSQGRYPQMRDLREDDELKEFFALFRSVVDRLKAKDVEEAAVMEGALAAVESVASSARAQQAAIALRALIEEKRHPTGTLPHSRPLAAVRLAPETETA